MLEQRNDGDGWQRKQTAATATAEEAPPGRAGDSQTTPEVRQAAAHFQLSSGQSLAEASQARMLVLVFLRHFGCTFTRQLLRQLEQLQAAAHSHDAELVLVHMLRSGEETRYLTRHDGVARIADPDCALYRAFGLKKGGWRELLGLHVWWRGLLSIYHGCGVGHLAGDGRQMPGAFLFHRGEILAAQRAKTAADPPDVLELFRSLPAPRAPEGPVA